MASNPTLNADYFQASDKVVGNAHPTKSDTINRALRKLLLLCGLAPSGLFSGFFPCFNVKAFGAIGDGQSHPLSGVYATLAAAQVDFPIATALTDEIDWCAVQSTVNAAGEGGRVVFPPGTYRMAGKTITGQVFQSWEGQFQFGTGGLSNTDGRVALMWTSALAANAGVVPGVNQVFRQIMFLGAAKNVTTGSAIAQGTALVSNHSKYAYCQFYDWGRGLTCTNAFYTTFTTCEWARCAIDVYADTCYNMHFYDCIARCWDNVFTNTGGIHVYLATSLRHLHISGGSMEGFSGSGGIVSATSGGSLIDLFGIYWESSVVGAAAFGVDIRGDNCVVNAIGNQVYLTEVSRWINASSRNNVTLNAHGNKFVCANTSTVTPQAYVLPTNGTAGSVDIYGDDWIDVALVAATYVGGALNGGALANMNIRSPFGYAHFSAAYQFLGRPTVYPKSTAAPATAMVGAIYFADRVTWDPAAKGSGNGYHVAWDGSAWKALY